MSEQASPSEISLRARAAANISWGRTSDRRARTEPARTAFRDRFDAQIPAEVTDPAERARRAEYLRRAYFQQLAAKSVAARRARKAS